MGDARAGEEWSRHRRHLLEAADAAAFLHSERLKLLRAAAQDEGHDQRPLGKRGERTDLLGQQERDE